MTSLYALVLAALVRAGLFDPVLNLTEGDPLFLVGTSALTDRVINKAAGILGISPATVSGAIRILSLIAAVCLICLCFSWLTCHFPRPPSLHRSPDSKYMKPHVYLPTPNSQSFQEYTQEKNIVIVGANGSGKTRFGAAIEHQNQYAHGRTVHRITAQKNLVLPSSVAPANTSVSESMLFVNKNNRFQNHDPITTLSNDYSSVLQLLFSRTADRDSSFILTYKNSLGRPDVPKAPIETLLEIWDDVLPDQKITVKDGSVTVKINGSDHAGSSMSDGQRVTFYLIAQCLIAPENSIIIADEPEIHLHKSLVNRLWNAIEKSCPNKLFIYITHDLDFAVSRQDTYKIWVKSFKGDTTYDWMEIPESVGLPEELLMEVLGSKKNVLFVEGEKNSIDIAVYQAVYDKYLVIPRSGCHKVIEATKAIRDVNEINHIQAFGIVDTDYRNGEEIALLLSNGVHTIDVAEIENLLCIEGVLTLVASYLHLDLTAVIENATDLIIKALTDEVDNQIATRTAREVQFRLNVYEKLSNTREGIIGGLAATVASIDANAIYDENEALYRGIIASRNLAEALKFYNRKSLAERLSPVFKLGRKEYPELVIRLLNSDKQKEVVAALVPYLPTLPN